MRKIHLPWQRGSEAAQQSPVTDAPQQPTPAGPYFRQNSQAAGADAPNPASYTAPSGSGYTGVPSSSQPPVYSGQMQTPFSAPSQSTGYTAQMQVPPFSAPSQNPGYTGQMQTPPYSAPSQNPGYTGQMQMPPFSAPSQNPGYTGQMQTPPFSAPSQNPGYTGQMQTPPFSAPPQNPGYTGQMQTPPFYAPSQNPGYTGQIQTPPYSAPVQNPGYTGQMQTPPYSAPVQNPGYTGQMQTPLMGFSGPQPTSPPVSQNTDQQDSSEASDAESKQSVGGFSFRPSFVMPDKIRQKLSIAPIHIAIIVAVLLLAGWYLFNTYAPQAATAATVQAGKYGAYYTGEALIVRNEIPYDADGVTSIDYKATEGSFINNSTAICDVFSSGFSTRELTTLQDYRDQIRDYEQELLAAETTYDARLERVESEVLTQAKEVRSLLAGTRGNLINQESTLEAAITARQQYLRQKYSSDQRLSRLLDDEQAQQQRIDSWTKTFYGTRSSLVSFYTDGYEYNLTVQNCLDFTPAQVRAMINGQLPDTSSLSKSKTTIYRTIMDEPWYVLMLVDDTSWNPVEGAAYTLELNQFENTQVEATVLSFTRSGGELLVRLRVDSNVENVLYMRTGTARLGDNVSTMMVPSRAIYRQNDMDGVVVIDGSNRFFVPVQIIFRDGNDVYVNSLQQGLLFEGQSIMLF
ncbi:MAG: hypothetical protein IJI38_09525 [Clostridia bacterium]|nr:hypothetical protein [Clostridia bacterium]